MNLHLLSPKFGKRLYRDASATPPIEVRQSGEMRWLHFGDNAVQSVMNLDRPAELLLPYTQAMMCVFYLQEWPSRILNLGIGGAGIERYLAFLDPKISVDSVEVSERVVRVARRYFQFHGKCELIAAQDYLTSTTSRYDTIFCDLYIGNDNSAATFDLNFFRGLSRCLAAKGIAVLNLLADSEEAFLQRIGDIRRVFEHVAILEVSDFRNLVLFCSDAPLNFPTGSGAGSGVARLPDIALMDRLRVLPAAPR